MRIVVHAGMPFDAAALRACAGDNRRLMMDAIGVAIANVLPPDYRGRYGESAEDLGEARRVLSETRLAAPIRRWRSDMNSELLATVTFLTALGAGLMAGLFFAFSISVMRALSRIPPPAGIAAMQAINIVILNPVFGIVFFGTVLACEPFLAGSRCCRGLSPPRRICSPAALLYLVGTFLVTMVFNVPRNNVLATTGCGECRRVECLVPVCLRVDVLESCSDDRGACVDGLPHHRFRSPAGFLSGSCGICVGA